MTRVLETPVLRGWESIEWLYELLNKERVRGYIAGSYAAWMMSPDEHWKPNDVDIFAVTERDVTPITERLCEAGYMFGDVGDTVVQMHSTVSAPLKKSIQIIKPHTNWTDFPLDIVNSFDLTICRAVLTGQISGLADEDVGGINGKILSVNNPLRAIQRILKYHARGVMFEPWELMKLFTAWDAMTPEQKEQLKESALPFRSTHDEPIDYDFDWDDYFFEE